MKFMPTIERGVNGPHRLVQIDLAKLLPQRRGAEADTGRLRPVLAERGAFA